MSANQDEDVADYQEDENEYIEGGDENYETTKTGDEDLEPEEMKKRVLEMEEELEKLTQMQQQVEKQITTASDKLDESSIYVGQVDYEATAEELRAHFSPCGTINRVTIMCDKVTGQAKGFAYIEFLDKESVDNALKLDDSTFKGRQLKVLPKRQNLPPAAFRGGRGGRGGRYVPGAVGGRIPIPGGRVAGRGRGGFNPYYAGRGGRAGRGAAAGGRFYRGGRGRGHPSYFNSYY